MKNKGESSKSKSLPSLKGFSKVERLYCTEISQSRVKYKAGAFPMAATSDGDGSWRQFEP